MKGALPRIATFSGWILLGLAGSFLLVRPAWAPVLVLLALATTAWPLSRARRGARGTELGPVIWWASAAIVLGMVAQVVAIDEPIAGERPGAGSLAYLSALATLAATISVFNARRPGGGAWAFLMGLLVLVFCLPWLEGSGLAHRGSLGGPPRLEFPWSTFFALLVAAGATNHAPTRFGPSAASLSVSLVLAGFAWRGGPTWGATMASASPWFLALAIWLAEARSRTNRMGPGTDRLWLWFRDHWGVVWALRVQERFNRAAIAGDWPLRLGWTGLEDHASGLADFPPDTAEATLKSLLRRFADADRIDSEAAASSDL